jgi:single-strand DNA-binding protein
MASFNKVILAGNLTRDPELRYTPGGMAIAKFGLALNRKWKDSQSGEMKEEVTFVDIDAFGKQAETIGQYLKKGRPILVEGRLRLDQWEDKQTQQKKSRLGVVLESFSFLDSGGSREGGDFGGGGQAGGSSGYSRPARAQAAPPPASPNAPDAIPPEEDDVPF